MLTCQEIETRAAQMQQEHMSRPENKMGLPLTGVQIAEEIGKLKPKALPAGTRYKCQDTTNPEGEPVVVVSGDGTVEDAVRAYNAIEYAKPQDKQKPRTFKQLIVEPITAKASKEA